MASRALTAATALATIVSQLAVPAAAQVQGGNYPGYPGAGYPGGTYPGGNVQLLRCESVGNAYRECAFPAGVTRVELARQLSGQQCVEGRTWGQRGRFGGGTVWVSDGCRAEFALTGGGGYPGGGYPGGGYPGAGQQGFAGEIACNSNGYRERYCPVSTGGRVEIVRLNGGACSPGRDWTFDNGGIRVRNGCRARFGYGYAGYAGSGYPGGGYPGAQPGTGFAGVRDCESRGYQPATCAVNTQGRVELLRLEGGQCQQGRDWSFDQRAIYVRNGCRARFGYGYGRESGQGGGIGTGGVVAGAAIAAGLIALLASRGQRNAPANGAAASISADLNQFPADARNDARLCIDEAARQVGATGGSAVRLDRVNGAFRDGAGYRITAQLTGIYSGRAQPLTMVCATSGGRVASFDVR